MLTTKDIELALPANLKSAATQQLTDLVNNIASDPLVAENVRDNFVSYTTILKEGKFKTEDYVHAIAYVSYKMMGMNNQEAYFRTFPARHQALLAAGRTAKEISAYVGAYHKNKLVNKIMDQALVPIWLVNQDQAQKAINVLAELMAGAQSEKVRCDSANALLTHLQKPKEAGPLINIDLRETSGMKEMKEMMEALATQQLGMIGNGMTTKDIAGQRLFTNE